MGKVASMTLALSYEKKIQVYFGHALTGQSEEFKSAMDTLIKGTMLLLPDYERREFIGLNNWKHPVEVYKADIEDGVGQSDLVVLFVDVVAGGVFIELCAALWLYGLPVLVLSKPGAVMSGLLRGVGDKNPDQVTLCRYKSAKDIAEHILSASGRYNFGIQTPIRFQSIRSLSFKNPVLGLEAPVYQSGHLSH